MTTAAERTATSPTAEQTDLHRSRSIVRWFFVVQARPRATAVLIGALATLLSLVNSWHVSLWIDEAYTVTVAQRSWVDLWRMIHSIDIVHSLYNALLHPWLSIFGVSELALRVPSAVATGVAAAGVVTLARRLAGAPLGLAAGLVFCVLPRVTWMGIEGRSYAATTAAATWLTVLFVALLRRPTLGRHLGYAALGAFAISLNIFLVLLLGAHGVALLLDHARRWRRPFWNWLASAIGAVAGGLPVLLTATQQSAQIGPARLSWFGYLRNVGVNQWFLGGTPTPWVSGRGFLVDPNSWELWKVAAVLLAALCWLLIAYAVMPGGANPSVRGSTIASRPLLLAWLLVPTVLLVAYATVASPLYNPRYLTYCSPAVAILTGMGLVRLRTSWRKAAAAALIVALATPVYVSQRTLYAKNGADWKSVAQFVSQRRGPEQAVYFAPWTAPRRDLVGLTTRTAATLYPDAFVGMMDLTLVRSPAEQGDLVGQSRLLQASVDRLVGVESVFVIRRKDYPAPHRPAEDALLRRAGFVAGDTWTGPLNTVVHFIRA